MYLLHSMKYETNKENYKQVVREPENFKIGSPVGKTIDHCQLVRSKR